MKVGTSGDEKLEIFFLHGLINRVIYRKSGKFSLLRYFRTQCYVRKLSVINVNVHVKGLFV